MNVVTKVFYDLSGSRYASASVEDITHRDPMSDYPNNKCGAEYIERYGSEWKNPTVGFCKGRLSLLFNGKKLYVRRMEGENTGYPAVSGKAEAGQNGEWVFDYSASRQDDRDTGPIPAGLYWIKPSELWENAWYKPGSEEAWGTHRITIHPYRSTDTFCRGGFFIHGGSVPGSAGCIDLTKNMAHFVKDIKASIGEDTKCKIELTVEYT